MSYMTLSSQEKPLFQKKFLDDTFFYSLRTFARIRQHYFSKYWEGRMHGPYHISNFLGGRPPSPPRSRGVQYVHWVMHKCIMVKVGGDTCKVCKRLFNFGKTGGEI